MNNFVQKIGILGGLFDPIHYGHIQIAMEIKLKLGLKSVLFIPACIPAHKREPSAQSAERHKMVELALVNYPDLTCSPLEINRGGVSYIVQTLAVLKEDMGEATDLFLIVGADNVSEIRNWHNPDRIRELATIAVSLRPGFPNPLDNPDFSEGMIYIKTSEINLSSSDIRSRIRTGMSITGMVPSSVEDYIKKKNLYQA